VDNSKLTSLSSLAEGESRTNFESNLVNELTNDFNVVSGHDHLLVGVLGSLRESETDGNIRSTDEELRSVVVHERGVTSSLLLGEDVARSFELAGRLDGTRSSNNHSSLDLFTLDTTEKSSHVVSSLASVELLVEHLDT
jgi:hypothetical protein